MQGRDFHSPRVRQAHARLAGLTRWGASVEDLDAARRELYAARIDAVIRRDGGYLDDAQRAALAAQLTATRP